MKSKVLFGAVLFLAMQSCRKPDSPDPVLKKKKDGCYLPLGTKTIVSTEYYIVACSEKECQTASVYNCKRFDQE